MNFRLSQNTTARSSTRENASRKSTKSLTGLSEQGIAVVSHQPSISTHQAFGSYLQNHKNN